MEIPAPNKTTVPGWISSELLEVTMRLLVTCTMPEAGDQTTFPFRLPPTETDDVTDKMLIFVANRIAPDALAAEMKSLFMPGARGCVFNQLPVPGVTIAS